MKKLHVLSLLFTLILVSFLFTPEAGCQVTEKAGSENSYLPGQILPFDPDVVRDTLDNGIVYYIRKNTKPEKRAELRLAVNAGSILEKDDQQGLAHFVEHMAFNGTRHFEKNELVSYLESIGMRFGPDINAYTSFDETVFMLHIPTDSIDIIRTAFEVLTDWAHFISFNGEEIDKERGVIIEEWRLGRGAESRILDKQFPVLFQGSRYAERLPIGKIAVLDTFHHEALRQFYNTWYRPDLQAIVAVGDFDISLVEGLIREQFADLPNPRQENIRPDYPVPPHDSTLFTIVSDPEARFSRAEIYYKFPPSPETTVNDYREQLVELLYNRMFNQRLSELSKKPDTPLLFASSGKGRIVRNSEAYMLSAVVKDNNIPRGFNTLLLEAKRVKKFGFTESELERNKNAAIRMMEQAFTEREKTESSQFAAEYIRNYLVDEPVPGIAHEFELFRTLMPGITLDEVNALAAQWISGRNRVVLSSYPQKEGIDTLTADTLKEILTAVEQEDVEPYIDEVAGVPLLESVPQPGQVIKEKYFKEIGATEWQLNNGILVVLKPTDFMNDEILFTSFSPGGYSLAPDSLLVAARTAVAAVKEGGLAQFSQEQLKKLLADKVVSVSPYIDELSEGISGNGSPRDMETLFQLIYLYFTRPRQDSSAFQALKERFRGFYENRSASPDAAFRDTITVTITQHNPRYMPWTGETVKMMNLRKSMDFYRDRFADASDFTFIFVGNFETENIKNLVETYLGSLPDLNRKETWRNVTYDYPHGIIRREVKRGVEPKSLTNVLLLGKFRWSLEDQFKADVLLDILRIKFREHIREDLGATYGVRVNGDFSRFPRERYQINISFGAQPEKAENLTQEIFSQMDSIKTYGIKEKYIQRVKEINLREYETSLKENDYWLDALESRYFLGKDPRTILKTRNMIRDLKAWDIQKAAKDYLNLDHYIQVTLYPENFQ